MNFKIPKVTFRTREGDEVETDGGCAIGGQWINKTCLLYTSPSPRDRISSRMPSSA